MNDTGNIKLSIIIPVYNAEKYLEQCMKSVINKSFEEQYEVILVDDGSTDGSSKICRRYSEQKNFVKYFYKKNGGPSSARNYGIQKSRGEFIVFIDSDDCVEDKFFEIVINEISSNYDLYIFDYKFKSRFVECVQNIALPSGNIENLNDWYESVVMMKYNAPWAKVFKSSIIKKNNIYFDEQLTVAEDLDFNMRYSLKISSAFVSRQNWYIHVSCEEGLCAQGRISYLNDFERVYSKICNFIEVTNLRNNIMHEVKIVFLRNCFSLIGANLNKAQKINFNEYRVYREILSEEYKGFKLNLEKFCLKYRLYSIMKIFSWYLNVKKKVNY